MNSVVEEFKNAFNRPDNGLVQIIMINIIVFVVLKVLYVILTLSSAGDIYNFIVQQMMLPSDLERFIYKPWSLFTYFFTHTGFLHIIFNMLFLYWFGKLIANYLGNKKVISLYVLGGIAGGLFFMLIYNILPYFQDEVANSVMLGASAGVFAIVVGAATLMPNFTFFLILIGPVKIKYIAVFYVFLSFVQSVGDNAGGELAHLAGALVGYVFIRQLQKGNDLGKPVLSTLNFFKSFFVKTPQIKVTHNKRSYAKSTSKTYNTREKTTTHNQDEIDIILDKISDSGYESLTKEEKQKLFNASKK